MTAVDDFQNIIENLAKSTRRQVISIYMAIGEGLSREDAVNQVAALINGANATAVTVADAYVVAQLEELLESPVPATGVPPVDDFDRIVKAVNTVLDTPPKTKFTRAEVKALIESAGLDPQVWDVPVITDRINAALRDNHLPDPDGPDYLPDHGAFGFEDFIETVNEHPRKLSARGLFPPPPPNTPAYAEWESKLPPELDSDDYADFDPIWEPEPEGARERLERLAGNEPLQAAQRAAGDAFTKQTPRVEKPGHFVGWVRQLNADACELCRWWAKDGRIWPAKYPMARHTNCACVQRIVITPTRPKPVRQKRSKKNG
jgi:hypothetical protein